MYSIAEGDENMSDLGNKKIMAENISRYLARRGMNMKDLSRALGVPYTTVCSWCNAESYPRIDKIEKMANLFGINKSDLVEQYGKETKAALIEQIYDKNKILFDAADDATPEEIKQAAGYLEWLKTQR